MCVWVPRGCVLGCGTARHYSNRYGQFVMANGILTGGHYFVVATVR